MPETKSWKARAAELEAPEAIGREVDRLIGRGRAREAVDVAKRLRGKVPAAEADAAIVRAYAARVQELVGRGLVKEAVELVEQVEERFPAAAAVLAAARVRAEAAWSPEVALAELADPGTEPSRRRAIEEALRRDLADPRTVASSRELPEEHPLKAAARAVWDAFVAVTSGPAGPAGVEALARVPRRSPLGPWRALVEAIGALYRRDKAGVEAALAEVPAGSRVERAARAVRAAAGSAPGTELDPVGQRFLEGLRGERTDLRERLARLDDLIQRRRAREAEDEARACLEALCKRDPRRARALEEALARRFVARGMTGPDNLEGALGRGTDDPELLRVAALAFEGSEPELANQMWNDFLARRAGRKMAAANGEMAALVLLRMAERAPAPCRECGFAHDGFGGRAPSYFDRRALLERARAAAPGAATFGPLVALLERVDPRAAEREAEAWHRATPRDLEPLLHLIAAAERRGAVRKALRLLEKAEAIDRLRPEVRSARFRLLLAGAEGRIRGGRFDLARKDLEELSVLADVGSDRRLYVRALEALDTERAGDVAGRSNDEVGLPTRSDGLFGRLVAAAATARIDRPVPPSLAVDAYALEGATAKELIATLARFAALGRDLGAAPPVEAAVIERAELVLRRLRGAPAHGDVDRPEDRDLLSVAGLARELGRPSLAYEAAGAGLAREGPILQRFLLERGHALERLGHVDALSCFEAALALAKERRDPDAVERACAAIGDRVVDGRDGTGAIDPRRVIARERARGDAPRPRGGSHSQPRGRKGGSRGRGQRATPFDGVDARTLQAFLESLKDLSRREPRKPGEPRARRRSTGGDDATLDLFGPLLDAIEGKGGGR